MALRLFWVLAMTLLLGLISFQGGLAWAEESPENHSEDYAEAYDQEGQSGLVLQPKQPNLEEKTIVLEMESPSRELTPPPWAGSSLFYRNEVSLPTFFKDYFAYDHPLSAAQCDGGACGWYNPYYVMVLGLSPSWAFSDRLSISAHVSLATELTQSDMFPSGYPVQLSDVGLQGRYSNLYTIPYLDVGLSANASLSFGTSQVSQAAAKLGAAGLGVGLSREFRVLNGLTLSFDVAGAGNLYGRGGGAVAQSLQRGCSAGDIEALSSECEDLLLGGGSRNVAWKLSSGYAASLQIFDWLTFAGNVGIGWGFLDSLDSSSTEFTATQHSSDTRYYVASGLVLQAKIPQMPYLTIALGESMAHGQLGADGRYISFRRMIDTMTFYLDLRVNLGSLVEEF